MRDCDSTTIVNLDSDIVGEKWIIAEHVLHPSIFAHMSFTKSHV